MHIGGGEVSGNNGSLSGSISVRLTGELTADFKGFQRWKDRTTEQVQVTEYTLNGPSLFLYISFLLESSLPWAGL